ncbi:unnamed protein product [Paramecium octaurelia]|uniref:Uncharacterized protein n=1 Tax=Paramecium octaurelia TaxID=43137 RepID=A0A8S1T9J3_PAROT|nr:unnamed protein product [Paramecium octaurelia]
MIIKINTLDGLLIDKTRNLCKNSAQGEKTKWGCNKYKEKKRGGQLIQFNDLNLKAICSQFQIQSDSTEIQF